MAELNNEQSEVKIDAAAGIQNTANSIGQFNSPEALYKSYTELQREYTKKCQALKEADKRMPRNVQEHFNELINKFPELNAYRDNVNTADMCGLTESLARLAVEFNGEGFGKTAEEMKEEICKNDEIRNKIFNEMIEEFISANLPKHAKNRGQIPMTPSLKPKSLNEATNMARNIIKTRRIN